MADRDAALAGLRPRTRRSPGWTVAVKDNIDVAGLPTTAGCPSYAYVPDRSAAVVARLVAAGMTVVGKTNLDQFATGLVGTRSPHGSPRNPVDAAWCRVARVGVGRRRSPGSGRRRPRHRHGRIGSRAGRPVPRSSA